MRTKIQQRSLTDCLENVIDYRGKTPKKLGLEWSNLGYRAISANNVKFDGLTKIDSINCLDEVGYKKWMKEEVGKGDILLTSEAPAGQVMLWMSDEKIVLSQRLFALRTKPDVYNKYLKYYLQSNVGQFEINKNTSGSTVFGISAKMFDFINVNIPDYDSQISIGDLLYLIDSKIELNNRINAELEAMAKTLYDYWFVQFDFPDKNNKPFKTSGGKMVWNEELKSEIPEGWKKGFLSSLGEITGGSTPPRETEEYFTNNGTAWITPKDLSLNTGNKFITKGELDVSDAGIKAASLNIMPKGTILLSSRAPVGYLAISRENVTTNQGFKSFVLNKGFTTEFVYYSIKNMIPAIENNAVGSTFKEISATTIKTIPTYLPDKKVVSNYTDIVKPIFERQNNLEIENQKITELRDWLLPMLMNGQVTVGKAYRDFTEAMGMVAEDSAFYSKTIQLHIPKSKTIFAKQVLAGKIISLFKEDKNFTLIKFQKLQFLAEHIAEADLGLNYYFQSAGPYDNRFMHTIFDSLRKSKWFDEKGYKFKELEKQEQIERYFQGYFSPVSSKLEMLFQLLLNSSEAESEIIATVYAVWNNRIILRQEVTERSIINDFYNWSDRKHKYSEGQIKASLMWLKKNKFEPKGFGKEIKRAKKK